MTTEEDDMTIKAQLEDKPTIKAVVAYAEKLNREAALEMAADIHASPYRPPSNYESCKKLCQKLVNEALREHPQDLDEETAAGIRASGPTRALAYMTLRARMHRADASEATELSQRKDARHSRRQKQWRTHMDLERAGWSLGRRADAALNNLRMQASPRSSVMDEDNTRQAKKVSESGAYIPWRSDELERAEKRILDAVRYAEDLAFQLGYRDMTRAA